VRGPTISGPLLGWEGVDFLLDLDLAASARPGRSALSTPLRSQELDYLHPRRVTCLVSRDGQAYQPIGHRARKRPAPRRRRPDLDVHDVAANIRYVRFQSRGPSVFPIGIPRRAGCLGFRRRNRRPLTPPFFPAEGAGGDQEKDERDPARKRTSPPMAGPAVSVPQPPQQIDDRASWQEFGEAPHPRGGRTPRGMAAPLRNKSSGIEDHGRHLAERASA